MSEPAERACLSLIADGMSELVTSVDGVDLGILGVALLPVPGRVLSTTSLHVLPPTTGVAMLSGVCTDPSAPTAVGDHGLIRVHATVPGLSMLTALAYGEDKPSRPKLYVLILSRFEDEVTVRSTCFSAVDSCLDFVDSDAFPQWALAST